MLIYMTRIYVCDISFYCSIHMLETLFSVLFYLLVCAVDLSINAGREIP